MGAGRRRRKLRASRAISPRARRRIRRPRRQCMLFQLQQTRSTARTAPRRPRCTHWQTANPRHARAAPHATPARLADPRLAGQEHHLTGARPGLSARAVHQRPFVRAADIRRTRHRSQHRRERPRPDLDPGLVRQRLPHHRERLHRLWNPLELQLAHRLEPGALDPARQHLRHLRHQIPSAGALSHSRTASTTDIPKYRRP